MKLRPRLSLLNLLLLTAIVAQGVAISLLVVELWPLREEVRRLRDEVGELSISNRKKLHAIQVETPSEREWKWRVWIPEGRTYRVRYQAGDVPAKGFPQKNGYYPEICGAGEQVIRYVIYRNKNDRWTGKLIARSLTAVGGDQSWIDLPLKVGHFDGVRNTTRVLDPGETALLIRFRVSGDVSGPDEIPDPADGFMIWLDPVP